MRNKKFKMFYVTIWSILFIVSLLLLIENIRFIHMETRATSSNSPGEIPIEKEKGSSKIQSDIPIMNYVTNEVSDNKHNIFIDTLAKVFPINQYAADAAQSYGKADEKDTGLFADVLGIIGNIRDEAGKKSSTEVNTDAEKDSENNTDENLPIDVVEGGVELEGEESEKEIPAEEAIGNINGEHFTIEQLLDRQFLYNNFYIIDSSTATSSELFDAKVLVGKDLSIKKDPSKPQVLVYHTHSQETFINSRDGVEEDTVVGVGAHLVKILEEEYGYNVIHDKAKYDIMGKGLDRNLAYNYARDGIAKTLKENPSIEVMIDVHRDGGSKRVTNINGEDTAQIMLFNGISTNSKGEPISRLENPYLQDNLAFSLQLQLKGRELFPGFMYKNYLKSLRYNLHFRGRSILAEVGTLNNTLEEAKNAMDYLAVLLDDVLTAK